MDSEECETHALNKENIELDLSRNGLNKEDNDVSFDSILEKYGGFGGVQRRIFILISLADITGAFALILPIFVGATPKWYCTRFDGFNGSDVNATYAIGDNSTLKQCWQGVDRCLNVEFKDDFTSIVSEWQLTCERQYVSSMVSSLQLVGVLVGVTVSSQVSDTIGRRISYFAVYLIVTLAGLISAFAVNWEMYAVCRFIVGFGYGGLHTVNSIYTVELVSKKWRSLCGTVGFWAVGTALLSLLGYLIRDWRHLALVSSASCIPYLLTWWWVPESPRWLIQKGRFEEADVIMREIAANSKKEPVSMETLIKSAKFDEKEELKSRKYSYLDLFRTRPLIKKTCIQAFAWFASYLLYYIVTFNLEHLSGDRYVNICIAGIIDLPAMVATIFLCNWVGRRLSYTVYFSIVIMCAIGIIVILAFDFSYSIVTPLALVAKSGSVGAMYVAQIYSAELFPTVIRNIGLGSGDIAARTAASLSPFIVLLGLAYKMAPYILGLALCGLAIPLTLLLPETNGKPLDDTPPILRSKERTVSEKA